MDKFIEKRSPQILTSALPASDVSRIYQSSKEWKKLTLSRNELYIGHGVALTGSVFSSIGMQIKFVMTLIRHLASLHQLGLKI
jgi:hypothetical protein